MKICNQNTCATIADNPPTESLTEDIMSGAENADKKRLNISLTGGTKLTAKEYLSQGTNINKRIESLERCKEICFSKATKSTPSVSDVPPSMTGGMSSKIEDNVLDMVDYDEKIDELKSQFEEFAFRAVCEISRIPNNVSAAILTDKYINGLSWEEIAENLGYDITYTQKELHGKALLEFDKNNPENTRKTPVIPM